MNIPADDPRPILFLDSGAGGLPYWEHFHRRNPQEWLIYTADRARFPYGKRERDELSAALCSLMETLIRRFNPKLAALVCNTAAVSALDSLRLRFPGIPWVGTVPAVKPAALESRARHIGVLGTGRTIEDPYIRELAARYGPDCRISGIAAPDLVDFVEYRFLRAGPEERRRAVEHSVEALRQKGADALVLGCTHFLYLIEEFRAAAGEGVKVYDSVEGVSRRIESFLYEGGPSPLRPHTVAGYPRSGGSTPATPPPGKRARRALTQNMRHGVALVNAPTSQKCGAALAAPAGGGGRGPPIKKNLLVLTGQGAPDQNWIERAASLGMELCLLDEETR
ncbi:MAG: glutamate racemase [Treponema sp.]|jgi:glutamate racemase|nr:glutamate racemase [Treponema sp.]